VLKRAYTNQRYDCIHGNGQGEQWLVWLIGDSGYW